MDILTSITSALQQYSSVTETENGDTAYRSTGSTNLPASCSWPPSARTTAWQ